MIYENGQTCAVLNFSNKICIPNPHYVRQCNAGVMEDFGVWPTNFICDLGQFTLTL